LAFTTTTGANGVVSLVGTSGVDTATLTALTSQVYVGAQGANDVIVAAFANGTSLGSAFTVNGGAGNDTVTFTGQTLTGSTINGDGGTSTGGADTMSFGTLVSSSVSGGDANDGINLTNLQSAVVNGNAGVDTFTFTAASSANNSSIYGGQGNDTIGAAAGFAVNYTLTEINGNKGDDIITIDGSTGFNSSTIFGGQGSDTINFTGAATVGGLMFGNIGNDIMTGGAGRDSIDGGEGIDSITGGLTGDSLTGGAGDDTFVQTGATAATAVNAGFAVSGGAGTAWVFTATSTGVDIVTDFSATTAGAAADKIDGTVAGGGGLYFVNQAGGVQGAANAALGANFGAGVNFVRGTWNGGAGTFTQSLTGADMLVATNASGAAAATGTNTNEFTVLLGAGAQTYVVGNFV